MILDDLLKEAVNEKEKKNNNENNREIDIRTNYLFVSFGTRMVLVYLFFIIVIGQKFAHFLNLKDLYFVSIVLATIVNVYMIIDLIKKNGK